MKKVFLSLAVMVIAGVMTVGWIAVDIALYFQWIDKMPILKTLITANGVFLAAFFLIGFFALKFSFNNLLSDETQIWDTKAPIIFTFVYLAICVIFLIWDFGVGFIDWFYRTVVCLPDLPKKDEWFGLFIEFRWAVIVDSSFCFWFWIEALWLLEQHNKEAWQKYGLHNDEVYESGFWKGDKYDAFIDTSRKTIGSDGDTVYYCEMTINGKKAAFCVGSWIESPLFYDYETYKTEEYNEELILTNKKKAQKGINEITVTYDPNNIFQGELPTIVFTYQGNYKS